MLASGSRVPMMDLTVIIETPTERPVGVSYKTALIWAEKDLKLDFTLIRTD